MQFPQNYSGISGSMPVSVCHPSVRPMGLLCFRADSFQGRSPSPSPSLLALSVCCPLSNQPISSGPPGFAYETKGVGNCTMQKTVSGRPKGLKINLARVFIFGLQMGLCCHRNSIGPFTALYARPLPSSTAILFCGLALRGYFILQTFAAAE